MSFAVHEGHEEEKRLITLCRECQELIIPAQALLDEYKTLPDHVRRKVATKTVEFESGESLFKELSKTAYMRCRELNATIQTVLKQHQGEPGMDALLEFQKKLQGAINPLEERFNEMINICESPSIGGEIANRASGWHHHRRGIYRDDFKEPVDLKVITVVHKPGLIPEGFLKMYITSLKRAEISVDRHIRAKKRNGGQVSLDEFTSADGKPVTLDSISELRTHDEPIEGYAGLEDKLTNALRHTNPQLIDAYVQTLDGKSYTEPAREIGMPLSSFKRHMLEIRNLVLNAMEADSSDNAELLAEAPEVRQILVKLAGQERISLNGGRPASTQIQK